MAKTDPKRRCPAMIEAGIEDPESPEGKEFCTGYCPYPNGCIAFEYGRGTSSLRLRARVDGAKELAAKGHSIEEISQKLGVSVRSIMRYLTR